MGHHFVKLQCNPLIILINVGMDLLNYKVFCQYESIFLPPWNHNWVSAYIPILQREGRRVHSNIEWLNNLNESKRSLIALKKKLWTRLKDLHLVIHSNSHDITALGKLCKSCFWDVYPFQGYYRGQGYRNRA